MAKNIVGIFENPFSASQAIEELEDAGIASDRIGIVMSESTRNNAINMKEGTKAAEGGATGAVIGGTLGALALGLTAVGSVVLPGVGFLAAGPIAAALAGAGAGGAIGGLVGGLVGLGFPEYEAEVYEEKLKAGNILVVVETKNNEEEKSAKKILDRNKFSKAA